MTREERIIEKALVGLRYTISREDDEADAAACTFGKSWWRMDGKDQYRHHMDYYLEQVKFLDNFPNLRKTPAVGISFFRFWYWVAMRKRYSKR